MVLLIVLELKYFTILINYSYQLKFRNFHQVKYIPNLTIFKYKNYLLK